MCSDDMEQGDSQVRDESRRQTPYEQLNALRADRRPKSNRTRRRRHNQTEATNPDAGAGINQAAEELLRSLPGITVKNVKFVMSKVNSFRELCGLDMKALQEILGNEPGNACWEFLHHGEKG